MSINPGPLTVEVLTLTEAAAYLRVEEEKVAHLAERGDLPARNVGGEWRFLRSALRDWLGRDSRANGTANMDELARLLTSMLASKQLEAGPGKTAKERMFALAGIWADDESVPEMLEEIYRERKAQRPSQRKRPFSAEKGK